MEKIAIQEINLISTKKFQKPLQLNFYTFNTKPALIKQKKSICEQQYKNRNDNLRFWNLVPILHQCKFINSKQLFLATEQKFKTVIS